MGELSLRKRFSWGSNFELQAAATDNGLNIALAEQHSPLGDVFHFLQAESADSGAGGTGLSDFWHALALGAYRALALLRSRRQEVPPQNPGADPMICSRRCSRRGSLL